MSEDKDEAPKGFTSTAAGVETNEVVNEIPRQTPDQFFGGANAKRPDEAEAPRGHATKGMTQLGYTEASRIENTAEDQERERKRVERQASREDR